jgi:Transposase
MELEEAEGGGQEGAAAGSHRADVTAGRSAGRITGRLGLHPRSVGENDPVHVRRGAPKQIRMTHTVGHEPSGDHHTRRSVNRWETALHREVSDPRSVKTEHTIPQDQNMQKLGHTPLVGEAAKIRAMVVRKTKTDRRDARHWLDLLEHDRFPSVWIPDPDRRDLRALVAHRVRLVRMRTMVKNGRPAIALNQRLALHSAWWTQRGLAQRQGLVLRPPTPAGAMPASSCSPG